MTSQITQKHRFHKNAVVSNKLLPLLCWKGAVKTPQENHHHRTSFDASEGEVAVCTGWEQRAEKQFKNSWGSCSSGESPFSTCNKLLCREEKSLRHVGVVAIFLDDNKPKVSLKKWIRTVSNFIDVIQFHFFCQILAIFSEVESKRTASMFRKRTFFCTLKRAREIRKFNVIVAVAQRRLANVQKRDARAELLCC